MSGVIQISCDSKFDQIVDSLKRLAAHFSPNKEIGEYNGWTYEKHGKSIVYNRVVTLAGSTIEVELPFSNAIKLNRVEQYFNTTNARTFNVRMYSNIDPSAYADLDTQSGNIGTSRVVQFGAEYKYPSATKLVIDYSSYTADDKAIIQLQVDEL